MYRVSTEIVKNPGTERVVGVKAFIEPPIKLGQEAVERYLVSENLHQLNDNEARFARLISPVIIGNTDKATVLYAGINQESLSMPAQDALLMRDRVKGLLTLLGVELA
jgi:hypothetical protein